MLVFGQRRGIRLTEFPISACSCRSMNASMDIFACSGMPRISAVSAGFSETASCMEEKEGLVGVCISSEFPPESPAFRPGSRAHCDVQVYVNRWKLPHEHCCYLTHSNAVVTRSTAARDYITEIVLACRLHGQHRRRSIYDCAYADHIVAGVRSPDCGLMPIEHEKWIGLGWIQAVPNPMFRMSSLCFP